MDTETFKKNMCSLTGTNKQNKIAELVNVSPVKISRWFSGQLPTLDDLLYISQKYHCSIDWLIGNKQDKKHLSAYDICKHIVEIDFAYKLDYRIEKGRRMILDNIDADEIIFGDVEVADDDEMIDISFPVISFRDFRVEPIKESDKWKFKYNYAGHEINTFLKKYFKARQLLGEGLIDVDMFYDIVNAHLNKVSNTDTLFVKDDMIPDDFPTPTK